MFGAPDEEVDIQRMARDEDEMGEHMSRQIEEDVRQELGLDGDEEGEGEGEDNGSFDEIKRVDGGMSMFSS